MNKKYLETLLSSILILVMILTPVYSVFAIGNQDDNRSESQKGATGEPVDVASYPLKLANEELSPQAPSIEIQPWQSKEIIEFKFVEGSSFRLVEGTLTTQQPDDLIGINGIFDNFSISRIERLFSQPEQEIEAERAELQVSAGEPIPDLNLWYRIWVAEGSDPQMLIDALNALPEVQTAYAAPLPAATTKTDLASSFFDPVTPPAIPNYQSYQGYLNAAPAGIDAKYAWGLAGGRGQNVQIVDIEYSWNGGHVDLPSIQLINGVQYLGYGDNHGTAVNGELVAKPDGVGVTGISYQSKAKFSSPCPNSDCIGYNPAGAINAAKTNSLIGDVILIEQQTSVCGTSNYGPLEWIQSVYDAIKVATTSGRIVVEAAGNGDVDLDESSCNNLFNRSYRDSGAIIVGAGAPPSWSQTARSRLYFSSYGSRVDVQGWGAGVYTAGYGDLYTGTGKNEWYTATFSGTSSASPIVAGAAALLSSVAQARGISLTPIQVRYKLVSTGSPQQAAIGFPITEHIGPLPNVKGAINTLASPTVPTPISPSVSVATHKPTYKWSKVPNAQAYILQLYQGTTKKFAKLVPPTVCGTTNCSITPTWILPDGNYQWRVRAKVGGFWRPFSAFTNFNVATEFHYQFTLPSSLNKWNTAYGPWNLNNGWYRSAGLSPYSNSVFHDGLYPTFSYIVRMRRINQDSNANRLILRGTVYPLDAEKNWNNEYIFQYTNNGYFSVWKFVNGTPNAIKIWTTTSAIKPYDWNKLKVMGKGHLLKFYINGELVWAGLDSDLATGKVGAGFYKGDSSWQPLLIDYAHLYTYVPDIENGSDVWAELGETYPEWDNPNESPPSP